MSNPLAPMHARIAALEPLYAGKHRRSAGALDVQRLDREQRASARPKSGVPIRRAVGSAPTPGALFPNHVHWYLREGHVCGNASGAVGVKGAGVLRCRTVG